MRTNARPPTSAAHSQQLIPTTQGPIPPLKTMAQATLSGPQDHQSGPIKERVKKANECSMSDCRKKAELAYQKISCKYCKQQFCLPHNLPEKHPCTVLRDERRKMLVAADLEKFEQGKDPKNFTSHHDTPPAGSAY